MAIHPGWADVTAGQRTELMRIVDKCCDLLHDLAIAPADLPTEPAGPLFESVAEPEEITYARELLAIISDAMHVFPESRIDGLIKFRGLEIEIYFDARPIDVAQVRRRFQKFVNNMPDGWRGIHDL